MSSADGRPVIMGILNVTPDSFSGDGVQDDVEALLVLARAQLADGAGILDVGGESTRPGSVPVTLEEELRRVAPAIRALAGATHAPLSVDTSKPEVAEAALRAGARILNDVSGLADPGIASVAATHGAQLVLMHNGWALDARGIEDEGDPIDRVVREIERLARLAERAGVRRERLIADPGLGFGKTPDESLALVARTAELCRRLAPLPLLVGPSRKAFIGHVLDLPTAERLEGTLAAVAIAAFAGAAIIRVHDVGPAVRVSHLAWSLRAHADPADGRA